MKNLDQACRSMLRLPLVGAGLAIAPPAVASNVVMAKGSASPPPNEAIVKLNIAIGREYSA